MTSESEKTPLDEFIRDWQAFSWEMSAAVDSFHGVLAYNQWMHDRFAQLRAGKPAVRSPHTEAVILFSNALASYFFISVCRVHEEGGKQISLPHLFVRAKRYQLLSTAVLQEIQDRLARTKQVYGKIKLARNKVVAHFELRESPFALLEKESVTRALVQTFLDDCVAVYGLLGTCVQGGKHQRACLPPISNL